MTLTPQVMYRQLMAIRDLIDTQLEMLLPMVQEATPGANQVECAHSERIDLRTLGDGNFDHWLCKDCGYEYHEDVSQGTEV